MHNVVNTKKKQTHTPCLGLRRHIIAHKKPILSFAGISSVVGILGQTADIRTISRRVSRIGSLDSISLSDEINVISVSLFENRSSQNPTISSPPNGNWDFCSMRTLSCTRTILFGRVESETALESLRFFEMPGSTIVFFFSPKRKKRRDLPKFTKKKIVINAEKYEHQPSTR